MGSLAVPEHKGDRGERQRRNPERVGGVNAHRLDTEHADRAGHWCKGENQRVERHPPGPGSITALLGFEFDILCRMSTKSAGLLVIATVALIGCSGEKPAPAAATPGGAAPAPWTIKVEPLTTPAAAGSVGPQLSVSEQHGPLLSWIEIDDDKTTLKFAERNALGWSQPQTVASGTDWFINDSDVPSVIRMSDGTLAANWLQNTNEELEAYNLRLSYSKDDGKTWAKPFLPHHDGTQTQHGFATLFEMPGKGLGVVWLDGRLQVKDREPGPMSLRYASYDGQWKQNADIAIDTKVCDCCSTSVAVTSDGPVAAFRNRTDEEIRDIYVSRLEGDKWTDGTVVHDDGWHITACPVNGPVVSARGRDVAIAWFTTHENQGRSFAALSNDAGRTWTAPIRLDEAGSLGRVDVEMLDDGSAVATWIEFANMRAQFRLRRVEKSGKTSPAITIAGASGGRVAGVPRLARQGNQLVFAWLESPEKGGLPSDRALKTRDGDATADGD